jgi:P-type Cu2+ transporter
VLLMGATQADESLLSGEAAAVHKNPGTELVAGSINLGAPALMHVLRVGEDTRFEAIVAMMRSAASQRPHAALWADRWAAPFLWVVLLLAAATAALWAVWDPARALPAAVAVLIVTCPCALSLAVPATLVAAAQGLARRGVMLQRLDALQTLAQAGHFFFDKTGTLTDPQQQLQAVLLTPAGRAALGTEATALQRAAGLAAWSAHPLSKALLEANEQSQVNSIDPSGPGAWSAVQEVPGQGLMGQDSSGGIWRLGSAVWVGGTDTAEPSAALWLGRQAPNADHFERLAAFQMHEALRADAVQTVQALLAAGVQVSLLSGDTPARAQALGHRLGLCAPGAVIASATPQDKLQAVAAAQARGQRVVMVGDGINDAPVLARADVSLAMGQGALVSRSQADAVLCSGRLMDIVRARATARKALRIVRQNLVWAAAYNAVCIPLALLGYLPPWAAGLGMACSSLVVVGNALRAAR